MILDLRYRTAALRAVIVATPVAAAGLFLSVAPLLNGLRDLDVHVPRAAGEMLLFFSFGSGALASFFVPAACAALLARGRHPWRFTAVAVYACAGLLAFVTLWMIAAAFESF